MPSPSSILSSNISIISVKFLVKNLEDEIFVPNLSIIASLKFLMPSVPSSFNKPLVAIVWRALKIEESSVLVHSSSSKLTSVNESSPEFILSIKNDRIPDKFFLMNLELLKWVDILSILSSLKSPNDLSTSSLPIISLATISLTALKIEEISSFVHSSGLSKALNAMSPKIPSVVVPSPLSCGPNNLSIKAFRFVFIIPDWEKYSDNWSILASSKAPSLSIISPSSLNIPLENNTRAAFNNGFNSLAQLISSPIVIIVA